MPREQKGGNVVSKRRDLRDGLDATARRGARQAAARRLGGEVAPDEDSRSSEAACGVDPRDDRQASSRTMMPRESVGDGTLSGRKARPGEGRAKAEAESDPDASGTRSRRSEEDTGPH